MRPARWKAGAAALGLVLLGGAAPSRAVGELEPVVARKGRLALHDVAVGMPLAEVTRLIGKRVDLDTPRPRWPACVRATGWTDIHGVVVQLGFSGTAPNSPLEFIYLPLPRNEPPATVMRELEQSVRGLRRVWRFPKDRRDLDDKNPMFALKRARDQVALLKLGEGQGLYLTRLSCLE